METILSLSSLLSVAKAKLADSDLLLLLQRAFEKAIGISIDTTKSTSANQQRSSNWVSCLRDEFNHVYQRQGRIDVRAFCKGCSDNLDEFNITELLHDVLVCRIASVPSRVHGVPLAYPTEVLWQAESEFANDGTEIMKDFNKLILGSAQRKLFVGPITSDPEGDLAVLAKPALCCSGELYVAYVSSPYKVAWANVRPLLFRFDATATRWIPV